MLFFRAGHRAYIISRKVLTATGLARPLRRWIGPFAGRLISRMAAHPDRPSLVRGHRMFLAANGGYAPIAMTIDKYERETTKLVERLAKPGMVVIDVGAHVGYYTLLAARQVGPAGRVYAFEPEPSNHGLLLRNIQLNGYTNIVARRTAVTDRPGSASLYLTALDNGRHSTYHHGLPEKGSVPVETTTLDAFLAAEGWPEVDLVKVDVEGAEMDVLEGARHLQEKCPNLKLIVEFSPSLLRNAGVDPHLFLTRLADWGFEVHCISESQGMVPLREADRSSLVDRLLKSRSSMNLFCTSRRYECAC